MKLIFSVVVAITANTFFKWLNPEATNVDMHICFEFHCLVSYMIINYLEKK